jgi:hypothetical protein
MYITPIERSQQLMSYHLKSISKTGASMIVKLQKLYHIIDFPTKTDKLTWKKKVTHNENKYEYVFAILFCCHLTAWARINKV